MRPWLLALLVVPFVTYGPWVGPADAHTTTGTGMHAFTCGQVACANTSVQAVISCYNSTPSAGQITCSFSWNYWGGGGYAKTGGLLPGTISGDASVRYAANVCFSPPPSGGGVPPCPLPPFGSWGIDTCSWPGAPGATSCAIGHAPMPGAWAKTWHSSDYSPNVRCIHIQVVLGVYSLVHGYLPAGGGTTTYSTAVDDATTEACFATPPS